MSDVEKNAAYRMAQLIIGALIFFALLYVDVAVRPVPIYLYGIPGLLMGVDPVKLLQGLRK